MLNNDDRAGLEEQYIQATTSSNLRVEADRRGPADVLIASGMSNSNMGGALMRLRSEYSAHGVPRHSASKTDHVIMMGRLSTFPEVLDALIVHAQYWRIEHPKSVVMAVLAHWLDDVCKHCEGRGKEKIKDTPTLSGKNCKLCRGTGHTDLTHGSDGRKVEEYIQRCLNEWRMKTARRLNFMR